MWMVNICSAMCESGRSDRNPCVRVAPRSTAPHGQDHPPGPVAPREAAGLARFAPERREGGPAPADLGGVLLPRCRLPAGLAPHVIRRGRAEPGGVAEHALGNRLER